MSSKLPLFGGHRLVVVYGLTNGGLTYERLANLNVDFALLPTQQSCCEPKLFAPLAARYSGYGRIRTGQSARPDLAGE